MYHALFILVIANFGFATVVPTRSLYISSEIGTFLTDFLNNDNIYSLDGFAQWKPFSLIISIKYMSRLKAHFKMPAFTLCGSRGSTNSDRIRLTLAKVRLH
jgi:hypothetical protein